MMSDPQAKRTGRKGNGGHAVSASRSARGPHASTQDDKAEWEESMGLEEIWKGYREREMHMCWYI